jgi:hypothetical protein
MSLEIARDEAEHVAQLYYIAYLTLSDFDGTGEMQKR